MNVVEIINSNKKRQFSVSGKGFQQFFTDGGVINLIVHCWF